MARITKRALLEWFRDLSPQDAAEVVRAAKSIRMTSNYRTVHDRMEQINRLIEGHGVEAVIYSEGEGLRTWMSDPSDRILALYVNTGDTYSPTVLWDARRDSVTLTTWGDFVENLPAKYTRSAYSD